jgi:hypothetical protein
MSTPEKPRNLENALAYLDALEAQDLDALAQLWKRAETDPELDRLLCEINQGVLEEGGLRPQWQEYKRIVVAALQRHLPSAFGQDTAPATLTVGDVAVRIASNDRLMDRLSPADRQANGRLQQDRTPLPTQLGMDDVLQLTVRVPVAASARYWREFQQVAVLASMSRGQAAARAAARAAGKAPPPNGPSQRRGANHRKGPKP